MREYLFEATGADGNAEKSSVVAVDVADARLQLSRMGYRDIRVLTDDVLGFQRPPNCETVLPALFINTRYDSLPVAVFKIYRGNWIYWLPGVLLIGEAWWSGKSLNGGITALVAGLLLTTVFSLPAILHNQALLARVRGRYRLGLLYVSLLKFVNFKGGVSALNLDSERAKMLAGLGKTTEALQLFSVHAKDRNRISYLTQLGAIHDAAGDREKMIAIQRQLLAESKNSNEVRIDLAWSLMRYTTQYEEARQLVAGIHASSCAELYGAGLRIVHGLLAQTENQHEVAARGLRKVHDDLVPLVNPLTIGIRAELRAYLALSLKALGRHSEADALWLEVLPLLKIHHCDLLIERYEEAA